MSLFATMNLANSALYASQLGLNVTAQNIAGAETPGYSRKRIELESMYRKHGTYGQIGFGVSVIGITRIRNEFIDVQIRRQSFELGKFKAIDHALESMENILLEPSDTGILEHMNKFFDAWENLSNNPADQSARTAVKASAEMLVSVFNNAAAELHTLKQTRNSEIVVVVQEINKIARDIFNLNNEIAIAEAGGGNANDSRDRRDLLMRRLAELVDYETTTDSTGQVTISMNGHILVSHVSINSIEVFEDFSTRVHPDLPHNQVGMRMEHGRVPLNVKGGQLKGLLDARDIYITDVHANLDELARVFVEKINEQHRAGYNLRGHNGFDFFDPTGLTASTIKLASYIELDVSNIAAAGGGLPSDWTRNTGTFSSAVGTGSALFLTKSTGNPLLDPASVPPPDPDHIARNIISGSVTVRVAGGQMLREGQDFVVDYVTGEIQLLSAGAPFLDMPLEIDFRYNLDNFPGQGDNKNAVAISELRKLAVMGRTSILGEPTSTLGEFYGSLIAQLGLNRNESMANIKSREYLIEQYDTHQDSIAGVSLDEEAANLIKYQNTYQAAARIFSAVQSMLDILMNL